MDTPEEADLTVLHAIGRRNALTKQAQDIRKQGKKYAVIQYCVRSTKNPKTTDWSDLWHSATCVWSYYDLRRLAYEDGNVMQAFPFYHAPLGVNADVFYPRTADKYYIIGTNGFSALTEGSREAALAAGFVKQPMFHLGPQVRVGSHVTCQTGITDNDLATQLSRCVYVSGLRRVEGFELPAAEGLLCGARPVFYDKPHYRQWFDDWAVFIPEGPRDAVTASLTRVFQGPRPPAITPRQRQDAAGRFDWQRLVSQFWTRSL